MTLLEATIAFMSAENAYRNAMVLGHPRRVVEDARRRWIESRKKLNEVVQKERDHAEP